MMGSASQCDFVRVRELQQTRPASVAQWPSSVNLGAEQGAHFCLDECIAHPRGGPAGTNKHWDSHEQWWVNGLRISKS